MHNKQNRNKSTGRETESSWREAFKAEKASIQIERMLNLLILLAMNSEIAVVFSWSSRGPSLACRVLANWHFLYVTTKILQSYNKLRQSCWLSIGSDKRSAKTNVGAITAFANSSFKQTLQPEPSSGKFTFFNELRSTRLSDSLRITRKASYSQYELWISP